MGIFGDYPFRVVAFIALMAFLGGFTQAMINNLMDDGPPRVEVVRLQPGETACIRR
jgi:hypothetical protein